MKVHYNILMKTLKEKREKRCPKYEKQYRNCIYIQTLFKINNTKRYETKPNKNTLELLSEYIGKLYDILLPHAGSDYVQNEFRFIKEM